MAIEFTNFANVPVVIDPRVPPTEVWLETAEGQFKIVNLAPPTDNATGEADAPEPPPDCLCDLKACRAAERMDGDLPCGQHCIYDELPDVDRRIKP